MFNAGDGWKSLRFLGLLRPVNLQLMSIIGLMKGLEIARSRH
jgi:hypothetical protein